MIVGFVVCMIVGLLCVVLGLLLWKKQMISLVHDYHHKNVQKSDVPAYTRLMGIGLLLIGIGGDRASPDRYWDLFHWDYQSRISDRRRMDRVRHRLFCWYWIDDQSTDEI